MMEYKPMRISRSTSLLLATALALGACGPVNRGLESTNQPVVQRTDYVYDVASNGALNPMDEQRLVDWLNALNLGYGDRISIDNRSGSTSARAAISAIVARYGLILADTAPVTQGSDAITGTRVVVSRSTASVPNCPNWDRKSEPEFAGSTMSNYGCAINSNLAAMVANPNDLIQGASSSGSDPQTISRAIKTYRDASPTGKGELKKEKASGGDN